MATRLTSRGPLAGAVAVALLACTLLACRSGPTEPRSSASGDEPAPSAGSSAASPTSPRPLAEPVILPPLPDQGVIVEMRGGLLFVGLDGTVVAALPRFGFGPLSYGVPGDTILRQASRYYVFRPERRLLRPLRSKESSYRFLIDWEDRHDIPRPSRSGGHWLWARRSPAGPAVLAQWSGECEIPTAFFVSPGGDLRTVTGEPYGTAPDSSALGWTGDGRAVVAIPGNRGCGTGDRSGLYLFSGPGEATMLRPLSGPFVARMWGDAGHVVPPGELG